jgi:hypothetical protein
MRDILPSLKQDTSDGLEGRMEWPSLRKGWVRRLQPFAKRSEELDATSLAGIRSHHIGLALLRNLIDVLTIRTQGSIFFFKKKFNIKNM